MGYRYNPFIGNFDRVDGTASPDIETLTGNSGGPVGPDAAFNINILGAGKYSFTGNPGTNTLTLDDDGTLADTYTADAGSASPASGNLNLFGDATQGLSTSAAGSTVIFTNADATEGQKGVSELATDAEAMAGSDNSRTIVPTSLKAKLGTQTSFAMPFGQGDSSAFGWTAALDNGEIVIGATGANPIATTITPGNGITITNAANFIRVDASTTTPLSFPTDSGTATPSSHALSVLGGSNINTAGSGATITINLDTDISVGTIDSTELTLDPGASGDSFVQFNINSTGEFRIGVDDTDDSYRISHGSALGTNDTQIITASGEVTFPLTPAFLAFPSATANNVTGDGTTYAIIPDTEVFDQNGDYNPTTGVFTVPITGRYEFSTSCQLNGLGAGHTRAAFSLNTSNRNYSMAEINSANARSSVNALLINGSVLADMDSGDTASMAITVLNSTLTVAVAGTAPNTFFSGSLQC